LERDYYYSTTYVSSFSPIEEFGPMLRQEAFRRGLALALQVVLLIDGAAGLANMGRLCFPTAIQIVDFYHALEHAGKVLVALLGSKEHPDFKRRLGRWARQLLQDWVEMLITQARQECAGKSKAQAVEDELRYFVNNVCGLAKNCCLAQPHPLSDPFLTVQGWGKIIGLTGKNSVCRRWGSPLRSAR